MYRHCEPAKQSSVVGFLWIASSFLLAMTATCIVIASLRSNPTYAFYIEGFNEKRKGCKESFPIIKTFRIFASNIE